MLKLSKLTTVAAMVAALTGCAGQIISEELDALRGQNVNSVFARLGYPNSQGQIAGQTVYVWSNSSQGSVSVPQTNYANSTVYSPYGGTYYGTTSYQTYETIDINYHCTLRVFVDANNTVTHWDGDGNQGGCAQYARALRR